MQTHAEIGARSCRARTRPLLRLAESSPGPTTRSSTAAGIPGLERRGHSGGGPDRSGLDVFDALTRDRPYRKAMPIGAAAAIMAEGVAPTFDPGCSTRS